MGKKRFFNFKNLFLLSFLAIAGIFSAGAFTVSSCSGNAFIETKADSTEKGTIYIAIEDQRNGWNDNQYFGCEDNGTVKGITLVIKSVTFASGSNYETMSDVPSNIINGRVGGKIINNGSTLSVRVSDDGYGTNVYNSSVQLPWIIYSITYNYVSGVSNREIYSGDMTATAGISYKDFIYHDGWDSAKSRPYHKVSHTTTGYSNEQVDYKPAKYFDTAISTETPIKTENVLYWTYYDPTEVSVDVSHRHFEGWYNSESYETQFTGPFAWHEEQYYFYGKYEYDQYNITYLDKGGSAYSGSNLSSLPSKHTYNTDTILVDGIKTGYRFDGWYDNSSCTGDAIDTLGATDYEAGITLYAKWTVKQYTLTLTVGTGVSRIYYRINGAASFNYVTSTTNLNVNYGTTYYLYAEATTGYTLNSPYNNYSSSNPYSNTKTDSTQSWAPTATINTYTVTIAVNNAEYGSVSQSTVASVPYGTVISTNNNKVTINGTTVTATPTDDSTQYTYAFSSWSNASDPIIADRTITANFTRETNNYNLVGTATNGTVAFYSDSLGNTSITSADYGASIYYRGIGNTGYGNTAIVATTVNTTYFTFSNGTATLKATPVCPANAYTITYKDKGDIAYSGSNIEDLPDTHTYGEETELIDGIKTGYTFSGWYTSSTCTGDPISSIGATQISDDITLYAKWSAKTSKLTFDTHGASGGTTVPTNLIATYGEAMPKYIPAVPIKTGYIFAGYYDGTGDGATQYYTAALASARTWDKDTTEGTTLHAKWTAKTTTVILDKNGGTGGDDSVTATYDQMIPDVYSVPTKDGYIFDGFYDEGGSQQFISASGKGLKYWSNESSTVTLYARWRADKYAVTISAGTGVSGVYLSTNPDATSGSASGTKFNMDSTVYGFVVLEGGYAHTSASWTLVSGTADTKGAIYRIGSLVVRTSGNDFGTINALSGETAAINYAKSFNTSIGGVCHNDGSTDIDDLATAWGAQNTAYDALDGYVQYWLDKTHASSDSNVTTMFAKYDYVYGKYREDVGDDFLDRDPPTLGAIRNFTPFDLLSEDENTLPTAIIIIASSVSLLSVTTLSILVIKKRKRKEQ